MKSGKLSKKQHEVLNTIQDHENQYGHGNAILTVSNKPHHFSKNVIISLSAKGLINVKAIKQNQFTRHNQYEYSVETI